MRISITSLYCLFLLMLTGPGTSFLNDERQADFLELPAEPGFTQSVYTSAINTGNEFQALPAAWNNSLLLETAVEKLSGQEKNNGRAVERIRHIL